MLIIVYFYYYGESYGKKTKKWVKLRHKIITKLAYFVLYPIVKLKYGVKINKFKEQGKRAYFIMMNHQTDFDQFFIGCAFKGPVYYVASEDLFSKGFISKLLKYAVAPIPIKKGGRKHCGCARRKQNVQR